MGSMLHTSCPRGLPSAFFCWHQDHPGAPASVGAVPGRDDRGLQAGAGGLSSGDTKFRFFQMGSAGLGRNCLMYPPHSVSSVCLLRNIAAKTRGNGWFVNGTPRFFVFLVFFFFFFFFFFCFPFVFFCCCFPSDQPRVPSSKTSPSRTCKTHFNFGSLVSPRFSRTSVQVQKLPTTQPRHLNRVVGITSGVYPHFRDTFGNPLFIYGSCLGGPLGCITAPFGFQAQPW